MEVEVEVYQGPLSKPIDAQWAELGALVDTGSCVTTSLSEKVNSTKQSLSAVITTTDTQNDGETSQDTENTVKELMDKLTTMSLVFSGSGDLETYSNTLRLMNKMIRDYERSDSASDVSKEMSHKLYLNLQLLSSDLDELQSACKDIYPYKDYKDKVTSDKTAWVKNVNKYAAELLSQSYHFGVWDKNANKNPPLCAFLPVAECAVYARSLLSRSELLLKQLSGEWRELMPLSAYLAESAPSLFTEYCLDDAGTCQLSALETQRSVGIKGKNRRRKTVVTTDYERINTADALLNENYWQRINHVHSSGFGDVTTAFIKDDVGNWSLKSFDSNPEELLKAYQDLSLKVIQEAANIVTGDASDVADTALSNAQKLLNLSQVVAYGGAGQSDPSIANNLVVALQQDTEAALNQFENVYEQAISTNNQSMNDLNQRVSNSKQAFCGSISELITKIEDQNKPATSCSNNDTVTPARALSIVKEWNSFREKYPDVFNSTNENVEQNAASKNDVYVSMQKNYKEYIENYALKESYEVQKLNEFEEKVLNELNRYQHRLEQISEKAL